MRSTYQRIWSIVFQIIHVCSFRRRYLLDHLNLMLIISWHILIIENSVSIKYQCSSGSYMLITLDNEHNMFVTPISRGSSKARRAWAVAWAPAQIFCNFLCKSFWISYINPYKLGYLSTNQFFSQRFFNGSILQCNIRNFFLTVKFETDEYSKSLKELCSTKRCYKYLVQVVYWISSLTESFKLVLVSNHSRYIIYIISWKVIFDKNYSYL